MTGLTNNRTIKSLATLDNVGVKDIGLKCFDISSIIGCLGTGLIFASFHIVGNASSSKEELIILATGLLNSIANFFNIQFGILSGP